MIVVGIVRLLKPTFPTQSNNVVLDRQVEVFLFHSRQLRLQHNLVLIFVDIYAGTPSTATYALIAEGAVKIGGEQTVYFLLQSSQVPKRVITNNTHGNLLLIFLVEISAVLLILI